MENLESFVERMKALQQQLSKGTPIFILSESVPYASGIHDKVYLRVLSINGGIVTALTPHGNEVTSGLSYISLVTEKEDLENLVKLEQDAQQRGFPVYDNKIPCDYESISYAQAEKNLVRLVSEAMEEDTRDINQPTSL